MSKLIRRTKKNFGAALLIALQILALTLAGLLMPFSGGPQQPATAPGRLTNDRGPQPDSNLPGANGNRQSQPA